MWRFYWQQKFRMPDFNILTVSIFEVAMKEDRNGENCDLCRGLKSSSLIIYNPYFIAIFDCQNINQR